MVYRTGGRIGRECGRDTEGSDREILQERRRRLVNEGETEKWKRKS